VIALADLRNKRFDELPGKFQGEKYSVDKRAFQLKSNISTHISAVFQRDPNEESLWQHRVKEELASVLNLLLHSPRKDKM
jgi:hypothetical protein